MSAKACRGILRRSIERAKPLPTELKEALEIQAGIKKMVNTTAREIAFHLNQRDEAIETGDVTGALLATPNMQMQTFVAGFCAGSGKSAGGIGYGEDLAPTLKGSPSGNSMPSVLYLNDQGCWSPVATVQHRPSRQARQGQVMDCSQGITGTLRSEEHGHQPLVFENHGIDSRYAGPHEVSPTLSARAGTGGNNLPLVEDSSVLCIAGNIIDRQPENGGNGMGYQSDISYTLTAMDRHAVYSSYQEVVGALCRGDEKGVNSQYVAQDKLILGSHLLIRRLTPLECERLQGFPDHWTELPGASDSARYQALGNSVAIPCVEFVLRGIASLLRKEWVPY